MASSRAAATTGSVSTTFVLGSAADSYDHREQTSRRLRTTAGVLLGVTVGAMSLAGTATAALAQAPEQAPHLSTGSGGAVLAPARHFPVRASRSAARRALAVRPPRATVSHVRRTVAVGPSFSGQASWYGAADEGRSTASGAIFHAAGLTAASRTLPFGTVLHVCRLGSCVDVTVNDRGPYSGARILDLSYGAAAALGFVSSGVAQVEATPVATRTVAVRHLPSPATVPSPWHRRPELTVADPSMSQSPTSVALDAVVAAAPAQGLPSTAEQALGVPAALVTLSGAAGAVRRPLAVVEPPVAAG